MADLNDHGLEVVSAMDVQENTSPEDYVKFVTQLGSKYSMTDFGAKLGTAALGLTGETAEIASLIFEVAVAGHMTEKIKAKFLDEFSDILWYSAFAAGNVVEISFEPLCHISDEIMQQDVSVKYLESELKNIVQSTGGFADIAKKLLYHGKVYDEDYRQKLTAKLKLTMMNLLFLAKTICNASAQNLINHNVKKLNARYKSLKFTTEEFLAKESAK